MKVFIIVFMVMSYQGHDLIVNPSKQISVVYDEQSLAQELHRIKEIGYDVDIKVYGGDLRQLELDLKYKDKTIKEPYVEIKKQKKRTGKL